MGVWVVSLSTDQLIPNSLTSPPKFSSIRSLIEHDILRRHSSFSALPLEFCADRYTKIYFGENQLSPGSLGILPLTLGHLNPLLRIRVRASPRLSTRFALPKVSSPGFGSIPMRKTIPIRDRFHYVYAR